MNMIRNTVVNLVLVFTKEKLFIRLFKLLETRTSIQLHSIASLYSSSITVKLYFVSQSTLTVPYRTIVLHTA